MTTTKTCRCTGAYHCQSCCTRIGCEHIIDREVERRIGTNADIETYTSTRGAVIADMIRARQARA